MITGRGVNRGAQQLRNGGPGWIGEVGREGNGQVTGIHSRNAVVEVAAKFRNRPGREVVFHPVTQRVQFRDGRGPADQGTVQPEGGCKTGVPIESRLPQGALQFVQRIVGHIYAGDAGLAENEIDVGFRVRL